MRDHRKYFVGCFTALLIAFVLAAAAQAQDTRQLVREPSASGANRHALVIGNSAYKDSPVASAAADAGKIAAALKQTGFETDLRTDLNLADLKRAIDEFGKMLGEQGGIGFFYFSGYGFQLKGKNYLVPVGSLVGGDEDVAYETVALDRLFARLRSAGNEANFVVIDAARPSPFTSVLTSSAPGLSSVEVPDNTLVAFSAAPGNWIVEDAAGYADEIVARMESRESSFSDALRNAADNTGESPGTAQAPWLSSSLRSRYFLDPQKRPEPLALPVAEAGAAVADEPKEPEISKLEQAAWDLVKDSSDPGGFAIFLKEFPKSVYAPVATIKLRSLENDAWAPVAASPDPSRLRDFLNRFPGGANAPVATIMLRKMDRDEWAGISESRNPKELELYVANFPDGEHAEEARLRLKQIEADFWDTVKDSKDPSKVNDYLYRYPEGEFAGAARARLKEIETQEWNEANESRNSERVEGYLAKYPEGAYAADAKALLAELKEEAVQPPKAGGFTRFLQGVLKVPIVCQPGDYEVALFYDANYKGQCVIKGLGEYANDRAIGLPAKSISSVVVGKKAKVSLCTDSDLRGVCETFTKSDSNLTNNRVGNDKVKSVLVQRQ